MSLSGSSSDLSYKLLCDVFDIEHPILLAPMAGVGTPQLAADVSNAGGLGALALGHLNVDDSLKQIQTLQGLTQRPFQLNYFCHQPLTLDEQIAADWCLALQPHFARFGAQPPQQLACIYPSFLAQDDALHLLLTTRPKAVSFHFGLPRADQLQAIRAAGICTLATATSVAEALAIEAAGIDMIVAQGYEAGGHRGVFDHTSDHKLDHTVDHAVHDYSPAQDQQLSTKTLLKALRIHTTKPIIAAGGIMTGQQIRPMLDFGASAVQMGTAFLASPSSAASSAYKLALKNHPQTAFTASISGRPARGIVNAWHRQIDSIPQLNVPAYPYAYDLGKQLHQVAVQYGCQDYAAFWAGTGVGLLREIPTTELMQCLIHELSLV